MHLARDHDTSVMGRELLAGIDLLTGRFTPW